MAVAGLHNLSALGPFFRETQSTVSRQWGDEPSTPRTPTSSLLQMWRELEGEHAVSHTHRSRERRIASDSQSVGTSAPVAQKSDNGVDNSEDAQTQVVTGSEIDHDDDNSTISEQSSDLGETERERVRHRFQEWMSSGSIGHSLNGFNLNNRSGPQCLGENECESVRVIREWVQMNSQQRNSQASAREGGAEASSQIQQVREGLVVAHPEIIARRPIRRLCGRQTLLDLLQRAQCERKEELQGLLERRPVSDFTHRNRIQALLRGRFLRNERMIPEIRPSSVAATELGLLRQRPTVSGLREGFLSKVEHYASTSANSAESDSWSIGQKHSELEPTFEEREMSRNSVASGLESDADGNRSQQEFQREVTEVDPVFQNSGNREDVSSGNGEHLQEMSPCIDDNLLDVSVDVGSDHTSNGQALNSEAIEQISGADGDDGYRHSEEINGAISIGLQLEHQDTNSRAPVDTFHDHFDSRNGVSYVLESAAHTADGGNVGEQFDRRDTSSYVDEFQDSITDFEEMAWQPLASVALTDGSGESMTRSWHETSGNELFQQTSDNNAVEQDQMQESHEDWPSHDLQEAIDSWLGMPPGEVGEAVRRLDASYYSDDENDHRIELRELFSRRRVSSLLRSGFRESLDQVLQSHVERLGHASGDWETDNDLSSPSIVNQEQGQLNGDRALSVSDAAERNEFAPTSPFGIASQPLWDDEIQRSRLTHNNLSQHFGMEWEAVNELRNDMARLQQRMNNMQCLLEQCMDMQIELQRSVQQEVSAALNRPIFSKGTPKRSVLHDESQWDYVRKGICCLCHDNNVDTLLYRCGHMCTCSKCAENLIQGTGKCPMCRAPVVEAVRAYFIQ